ILLGAMFGAMLGAIAFFLYPDELRISVVVALSILISMSLASFTGTLLPILFYKLNKDPAVASGPFVTTAMDIMGVAAYLGIAVALIF
ncbi:MAG TPA: magnesium transporter, partial [Deltaproteobacteria bacterium]|nr:magnesium transporter [Deltaproteobacteria bacterium]